MNASRSKPVDSTPLGVVLRLAPTNFLGEIRTRLLDAGVVEAIKSNETAPIFDWVMGQLVLQGISDHAAITFQQAHGRITWSDVENGLLKSPQCPRLRSWWHFECGYRKSTPTCAQPGYLSSCCVPRHDLRKGVLNEAAYGFALFVENVCDGDLVRWIDNRMKSVDRRGDPFDRGLRMGLAVLDAFVEIPGTGPKIWSLVLADLFLSVDLGRERWIAAGASLVVIDTLTHNFLHRTGTLRIFDAEHAYGPSCYRPKGCAEIVRQLAQEIDAREFDTRLPSFCPRFVQHAIWHFCAEGGRNVCNGRQIDDRSSCHQAFCPAGQGCARLTLKPV